MKGKYKGRKRIRNNFPGQCGRQDMSLGEKSAQQVSSEKFKDTRLDGSPVGSKVFLGAGGRAGERR
jgi:hypothetical protein